MSESPHPHPPAAPAGLPPRKVGEIMETEVMAVPPDMPVADLLTLLVNKPYKALPVVDAERRVLGMVTDGDLLRAPGLGLRLNVLEAIEQQGESGFAAIVDAVRAGGKTVRDVMGVRPQATIGPDAAIADAARLMVQQGVKRLPVVDAQGRLLGILGRLDILKAAGHVTPVPGPEPVGPPPAAAHTLGDVMLRDVPVVTPDTDVEQVVDTLVGSQGARRVVVIAGPHDRRVLGMITAADLVRRSAAPARGRLVQALMRQLQYLGAGFGAPLVPESLELDACAGDVMTAPATTAPADLPLAGAIHLMVTHGVKALPVVDTQGQLVGLVTRRRVLQALAQPAAPPPDPTPAAPPGDNLC
jgi:CBS domain-containing protein